MSVKQPGLRGLGVWYVVAAVVWGVMVGAAAAPQAMARHEGFAGQEPDKKDKKKDEKKEEKKGLPLQPDRKIEFSTDEGTWLSLDVSPDGKTIVFELLGDIYTLPIEGGQAKLIDGGMAFDSTTTKSSTGSPRTASWTKKPSAAPRGSARMSTPSRSWPPRWPSWYERAA